jgi:hypothetical protein
MCFFINPLNHWFSKGSKESATSSHGIRGYRGYVSIMATSKFTYFLIKQIMFC